MNKRFTEEFRREAVRQIKEHGHPVAEVSERLGVSGMPPFFGQLAC